MKILGRNQVPPPAKTLAQEEAEAAELAARERQLVGLDDEPEPASEPVLSGIPSPVSR